MFMRYLGGGIGHHSTTTLSEWRDIEGINDDELEIPDAANEGTNQVQGSVDHPPDDVEHPNEEDYTWDDVVSNEWDVQPHELEDYEYTNESEEEDSEVGETSDRDGGNDDLGPEDGEDWDGIDSDVGFDYDD